MRAADWHRISEDVGRRVAELRSERGLTQEALAEQAKFSLKYLQRVEAGRENLTIESLTKLANVLRVPVVHLFVPPASRGPRPPGRPRKKTQG